MPTAAILKIRLMLMYPPYVPRPTAAEVAQCLSAVRLPEEEKEILKCLPLDPGIQEEILHHYKQIIDIGNEPCENEDQSRKTDQKGMFFSAAVF